VGVEVDVWSSSKSSSAKQIARKEGLEVQKVLGLSALGCKQVNVGLGRPWRSAVSLAATAGARSPGGLSELGCKQANVGLGRPWRSAASGDGRCSKSRRFWG